MACHCSRLASVSVLLSLQGHLGVSATPPACHLHTEPGSSDYQPTKGLPSNDCFYSLCAALLSLGRQPGQDGRPQGAASPSVLAQRHLLFLTSLLLRGASAQGRKKKEVNGLTSRANPLQTSTLPSYIQAPPCLPAKVPMEPSSEVPREYV